MADTKKPTTVDILDVIRADPLVCVCVVKYSDEKNLSIDLCFADLLEKGDGTMLPMMGLFLPQVWPLIFALMRAWLRAKLRRGG